jgi:periplasmic protein TonB
MIRSFPIRVYFSAYYVCIWVTLGINTETKLRVAMTNFDDILFANRNRAYGAYVLRQTYRSTLSRAVLIGSALFLGGLQLPRLYALVKPEPNLFMTELTPENFKPDVPKDEPAVAPPPPAKLAPAIATVRNPIPEVVADAPDDVVDVATVDELQEATSGQTTQEGTGDVELILAPEAASGPTTAERAIETPEHHNEQIFIGVEQDPEFPGGLAALGRFLQQNIQYPMAAARANVSGRVFVSFTVNTDGSITDSQVLKGLGFGTDDEALRVLKAMPRWKPGRQSGRAVRVRYNLPISFTLE